MTKGFYRVELKCEGKRDWLTLFLPLDGNGALDLDGEAPPYLFKALWDGEDWAGEFEPGDGGLHGQLVWLGGGTEAGSVYTDLLTAPLCSGGLVSVSANDERRMYRVTSLRQVR